MDWFTDERKEKLKTIMAEDYGVKLSDGQAKQFGSSLVEMFDLLYNADKAKCSNSVLSGYIDDGVTENIK